MREQLAVVDDGLFYLDSGELRHEEFSNLEQLLRCLQAYKIGHVWVSAGCNISASFSLGQELAGWNIVSIPSSAAGHVEYLSARRNDQRYEESVRVGFAEYSRFEWKEISTPRDLLAMLFALEGTLGLPIEWTPAHVAMEFIRRENEARWSWLAPCRTNLENEWLGTGFTFKNGVAQELHWKVGLPAGATRLIKVDGNSDYAAAMTGLNIGEGEPVYTRDPESVFNGKSPGFWWINGIYAQRSIFDGRNLPSFESRRYLTTDMVVRLRASGYSVHLGSGYYWPEYHQTLRSTAEKLWKLRVQWRAEQNVLADLVHESLRYILKTVHGKFGDTDTRQKHFQRRDIWALVVAASVARRIYQIEKIWRDLKILPVKIDVDALWFALSDAATEEKLTAMCDLDKLGSFKLVEAEWVTPSIRERWEKPRH